MFSREFHQTASHTDWFLVIFNIIMVLCRITQRELAAQRSVLAKFEKDGKLEEYLDKEPSFMYSLLTDPRMTDEMVDSIMTSLFGAGIDSVSHLFSFLKNCLILFICMCNN